MFQSADASICLPNHFPAIYTYLHSVSAFIMLFCLSLLRGSDTLHVRPHYGIINLKSLSWVIITCWRTICSLRLAEDPARDRHALIHGDTHIA